MWPRPESTEKRWGGAFRGPRRWKLPGGGRFPSRRQWLSLCCPRSKLEGKKAVEPVGLSGRWEAGRPGGLPGKGPAPLWRRPLRRGGRGRGTGLAGRGSGGQVCCGVGPGRLLGRLQWSRKGRRTEGRAGGAMEGACKFSGPSLALGLGSASAWRRASQRWAWPLRSLRPGGDAR